MSIILRNKNLLNWLKLKKVKKMILQMSLMILNL